MKKKLLVLSLVCSMVLASASHVDAKKISSLNGAKKLAQSKVKGVVTEVESDYENGALYYEVSLVKSNKDYTLTYKASNGKLMKYEWELTYENDNNAAGTYLSKKKVKKLAKKAVKKATIKSVVLDVDDDDAEYKVKLKKGKKTYTLVFDAVSGKLEDYEWKLASSAKKKSTSYIGAAKAKSIASKKVPTSTTFIKVEFDKDDGRAVYEIEMRNGNIEYELTIDAKTGSVLEFDSDIDD